MNKHFRKFENNETVGIVFKIAFPKHNNYSFGVQINSISFKFNLGDLKLGCSKFEGFDLFSVKKTYHYSQFKKMQNLTIPIYSKLINQSNSFRI